LVAYLSKAKGEICGRVDNRQLNRLLVANQPSDTPVFRRLLLGAGLVAGVASTANGQSTVPQNKYYPHAVGHTPAANTTPTAKPISADTATVFTGTIIDSKTKQPLDDARLIFIYDSLNSAFVHADTNGHFFVNIPNQYLGKKLNVIVDCYGYTERTVYFNFSNSTNQVTIRLRKSKEDMDKVVGKMYF
jgi:hypothetical protein